MIYALVTLLSQFRAGVATFTTGRGRPVQWIVLSDRTRRDLVGGWQSTLNAPSFSQLDRSGGVVVWV